MIPLTCASGKKMIQLNLFINQKQTHRYRKQTHGYCLPREKKSWGVINEEFGISRYTLIYINMYISVLSYCIAQHKTLQF